LSISDQSLFKALEQGVFADIKRSATGGKGLEGVILKNSAYFNPVLTRLKEDSHAD